MASLRSIGSTQWAAVKTAVGEMSVPVQMVPALVSTPPMVGKASAPTGVPPMIDCESLDTSGSTAQAVPATRNRIGNSRPTFFGIDSPSLESREQ